MACPGPGDGGKSGGIYDGNLAEPMYAASLDIPLFARGCRHQAGIMIVDVDQATARSCIIPVRKNVRFGFADLPNTLCTPLSTYRLLSRADAHSGLFYSLIIARESRG